MILDFMKKFKNVEEKKAVIFNAYLQFFKDLDKTSEVNIPYFIRAKEAYNENVTCLKDINYLYNKIMDR